MAFLVAPVLYTHTQINASVPPCANAVACVWFFPPNQTFGACAFNRTESSIRGRFRDTIGYIGNGNGDVGVCSMCVTFLETHVQCLPVFSVSRVYIIHTTPLETKIRIIAGAYFGRGRVRCVVLWEYGWLKALWPGWLSCGDGQKYTIMLVGQRVKQIYKFESF